MNSLLSGIQEREGVELVHSHVPKVSHWSQVDNLPPLE